MKKQIPFSFLVDFVSLATVLSFIIIGVYIKFGGHIPSAKWVAPAGIFYIFGVTASFVLLMIKGQKYRPILKLFQWFTPSYVGHKRAIIHRVVFVGGVLVVVLLVKAAVLRFE
jgi:hypothetical protein